MNDRIKIVYDMETGDPDDPMTLALLATHPKVDLIGVTVCPGSIEQMKFVQGILDRLDRKSVAIGGDPDRDAGGINADSYRYLFGEWDDEIPLIWPAKSLLETLFRNNEHVVLVTGAPMKNMKGLEVYPWRWVGQGGFAGDQVVPEEYRLEKFRGRQTCPTFNFNGSPEGAFNLLNAPIATRMLVSKNVCHGVVYDYEMHMRLSAHRGAHAGLDFIMNSMDRYLARHSSGKKWHDPLAACCAIDWDCCEFREVEVYREKDEWGSRLKRGTDTFIAVKADVPRMISVMAGVEIGETST